MSTLQIRQAEKRYKTLRKTHANIIFVNVRNKKKILIEILAKQTVKTDKASFVDRTRVELMNEFVKQKFNSKSLKSTCVAVAVVVVAQFHNSP